MAVLRLEVHTETSKRCIFTFTILSTASTKDLTSKNEIKAHSYFWALSICYSASDADTDADADADADTVGEAHLACRLTLIDSMIGATPFLARFRIGISNSNTMKPEDKIFSRGNYYEDFLEFTTESCALNSCDEDGTLTFEVDLEVATKAEQGVVWYPDLTRKEDGLSHYFRTPADIAL